MRGVVGAHGVDEWTLRFAGRHPASIEVYGGGGSRLHCVVHDAAGTVVDTDTSAITGCLLYLVPPRTGAYRVVIRNRGGVSSAYWLVTN